MKNSNSISDISAAVINEVRASKLIKIAELDIVQNPPRAPARTEVGQLLQKLAYELRGQTDDVTIKDVKEFFDGVENAC
jgi:hypothetical protein